MTVRDAAKLIGTSPQTVRLGLQQKAFPFGSAVKTSSRWTYVISDGALNNYIKNGSAGGNS